MLALILGIAIWGAVIWIVIDNYRGMVAARRQLDEEAHQKMVERMKAEGRWPPDSN